MLVIRSLALLALAGPVRAQSSDSTTISNGQLQECGAAMFRVDVDNDSQLNRAEYINLLTDLSPYKLFSSFGVLSPVSCPDVGRIEDFLRDAPLSALFEEFACLCLEHEEEGLDCCKAQADKHLKVPGIYDMNYTREICTAIYENIESECTTAAPTVSAAPSPAPTAAPSSAPTVSAAPSAIFSSAPSFSAVPSSVPTLVPTSNIIVSPEVTNTGTSTGGDKEDDTRNYNDDNDNDDIIKIVVPVVLGLVLLCLVCLFLVFRSHQSKKKNTTFHSFKDAERDSVDRDDNNMVDNNDDMILFSYDKENEGCAQLEEGADPTTEVDSSISNSDSNFVFMDQVRSSSDGDQFDEEQGARFYPAATDKTSPLSGESEAAPFDNRHHELDLDVDLNLDQDHHFNGDKSVESGQYHTKSVGSLTWSGGEEDSHDSKSSSSVDDADPEDSLAQSIEKIYISADKKEGKLDSREAAINAIIEQSKAGAEWFEFELPSSDTDESSDGDHDDADADDENTRGSYRLKEGLDPEDAKALEAILSEHNVSLD